MLDINGNAIIFLFHLMLMNRGGPHKRRHMCNCLCLLRSLTESRSTRAALSRNLSAYWIGITATGHPNHGGTRTYLLLRKYHA